jgi:hypothetical protein
MSSIQILLPDHFEVFRELQNAEKLSEQELDRVLRDACTLLEGTLKTLVQTETHGSGMTASSIETREEGELTYGVGSYTRGTILRFLDMGTGIYRSGRVIIITPQARRALHFWVKETGDEVFASMCVVMGILPFYFMQRAWQEVETPIDELMKSVDPFQSS